MNKFKTHLHDGRHEDYSKRKQQVQLLGILDKCTQVLRDDRIWLRNKIKQGEAEVMQIFKKYMSKRPLDLSALQVNLRKYVMRIKQKCKKDQLQKFKENLNSATGNTLFDRQTASYSRSSKSIPMKRNQPKMLFDQLIQENIFRNYSRNTAYDARVLQQMNTKRNNLLSGVKVTDPIDEQEENQQGFSYRSRSEHKRHKTSQRNSNEKMPDDRVSLPWQRPINNFLKVQKELELGLEQDQDPKYPHDAQSSLPFKQSQPPLLPRQKTIPQQPIYQIEQSHVESNSLSSHMPSQAGSNFRTSVTYYHNQISQSSATEFKLQLNYNHSLQPPSFSATPAVESSLEKHLNFAESSIPISSNTFSNTNSISKVLREDENLFTSPQLLMQCRRFLKQSNHKPQNQGGSTNENMTYPSEFPFESSATNSNRFNQVERLALRAKSCNSEMKILNNNPISVEKCSINPLPHLMVVQSFQKDVEQSLKQLIPDISRMYAEDVFEIVFSGSSSQIDMQQYQKIVYQNFTQKQKLMKLFKLGDKDMNNTLLATDFGRLLLTNCNYKPSPNPVKEVFSLIDIDRKGYFTLDDYERFLEQVVDAEDPESTDIINICSDLFQMADVAKNEKVEYWGLYLARNSRQFEEFSAFLEQFEFEFEEV